MQEKDIPRRSFARGIPGDPAGSFAMRGSGSCISSGCSCISRARGTDAGTVRPVRPGPTAAIDGPSAQPPSGPDPSPREQAAPEPRNLG